MARKPTKQAKDSAAHHVLPEAEIIKRLMRFGYFGDSTVEQVKNLGSDALASAIRTYQEFNGLLPTGLVGPKTAHKINRARCGLPDFNMTLNSSEPCKWPMAEITYCHDLKLPGLTKDEVSRAYTLAISQWAEVCAIEPKPVAAKNANIYARSGVGKENHLDNKGGTLAWSELPCGVTANVQLDQMFDEAEDWSFDMAVAVMCHEIGHALGLPHLANGNLMAPYYDAKHTKPQKGDIKEIVSLYGKRTTQYALTAAENERITGSIVINGCEYNIVLVPKIW